MVGSFFKKRMVVAAVAAAALLASAIGPARAQQPRAVAHAGGVLVYPDVFANLWVKALDPALLQDTQSQQVVGLVYSGLLKLDQFNHVVPDLAAAMPTLSADKKTYTFKIRPNAMFSDGTPVTAQDFVYSWTRALTKKEQSPVAASYMPVVGAAALNAGKASTLPGAKALDAHTVQVTFTSPCTCLLGEQTYTTWDVVEPNVAIGEDLVGPNSQAKNVGTGPFMFSKPWRYRQEMYLAPNPHWYNASKIKLSEIDIPMVSDNDALYREYQAGQLPMTIVTPSHFQQDASKPDFHKIPQLAIDYISLNQGANSLCKPTTCAPFNDIHFRRAMMYAIDRNTINSKILHGTQVNLCGIVPQGIDGYSADLCKLTPYDPTRAKTELALALKDFGGTIPNAGKLVLTYQTSGQAIANEYTEIQSEWAAVGINVSIRGLPFNNWVTLVSINSTPLTENTWIDDYPDAQDFTHNLLSVKGAYDITNYNDPQFEKLIDTADVTPVGPDRSNLYIQAQMRAINAVAFISIGQVVLPWRWKSNLQNIVLGSGFNYPIAKNNDWTTVSLQ
ncbi:MAG TPA: peptide ABC transporter substrate-binding protein [Chloroflexota bacterium]|nr:peptide ABC transporter substrate-binding protein [Chloroflexota bacterium]